MKTIVLGNGYIGSGFAEYGNFPVIGKDQFEYTGYNFNELIPLIADYDVIINCIGFTDTKASELKENGRVLLHVNSNLVGELSKYCNENNKKFVHISTGDLYGNSFTEYRIGTDKATLVKTEWEKNVETCADLDIGTEYRFSKVLGERMCNLENDLVIRIRLPFDGRNHPKNLMCKVVKFTNFYMFQTSLTYVPDMVKATIALVNAKQSGIFNVTQNETASILFLMRNVLQYPRLQHIDIHDKTHPNIIAEKNTIHVHNDINIEKLLNFYTPMPLEAAWIISHETLLASTAIRATIQDENEIITKEAPDSI